MASRYMSDRTHIESFRALGASVPESWQDAEVAFGDSIDVAHPIRRVALHEDADGRRVIVLYEDPLDWH